MHILYNQKRSETIKGLREDTLTIKLQFFVQFMKLSQFSYTLHIGEGLSPQEEESCNITSIYSNGVPCSQRDLRP